ncbi:MULTISPECIES: electron transfer flavoprotein subunit alpha/FixB family protein [Brevibacillus]|jgi:electron transfer flavoprotein alpha subunit|uniref:Electron transfer flavoprotein alpha subunit n=1 Tax=Brevibacillus aydinogluensis TaxID=927786 RepID=A0AA48M944_9BACL|nr:MULTISPECIES: electron transfer flavoprotein subunit alpha/FixB family protein [Brevibacillus]REK63342.1 MAG: electron transfer flavoprotein subunit alpha [Brevibacillus sp.]MBR8660160.1 electron transfer flavoprotein subunit alpha/FixB family protein [Brevibacillus sp. NL20B1]MDT3414244.1 electron transfer flavoprotein alpha subunit [Brevibacillus aydinogluensis]NNV03490.1 electron transfer flavoprotein subunit alpha/FixB family protein [Brevibacillus sp. MCWH]CAJ1003542.1 Electron transfe
MKKVLVLAETRDGQLRNVSLEALAAAQVLAEGGEVVAALFGPDSGAHAATLGHHGAGTVYVADHAALAQYTPDAYVQALKQLIDHVSPDAVVLGHTAIGRDVAPRVAARLGYGLISDVTALEPGPVFTRPIYAGKAFQKRKFSDGMIMITIRPNNIPAAAADTGKTATVVPFDVEIKDLRSIVKEVVRKTSGKVDLSEAKIIVSGGRGVKSADGFKPLYELAEVLGAAVGASRGACDADYCDYSMQIGQTGKVVTPDLYIACGISGAIQHLAGMSNSKVIVAINKDPEAPIFQVADYGIVGDLFEVVPLLTAEFKKVLV